MRKILLSISMILGLVFNGRVYSAEVPKKPILSMEMEMHSAQIYGLAVDAQNQF